jgi:hypothetical protein
MRANNKLPLSVWSGEDPEKKTNTTLWLTNQPAERLKLMFQQEFIGKQNYFLK